MIEENYYKKNICAECCNNCELNQLKSNLIVKFNKKEKILNFKCKKYIRKNNLSEV